MMKKILCVVGTRPEVVKMAPVILALKQEPWANVRILATAQHRALLDQPLALFKLAPDIDLDIMQPNQELPALTARLMTRIDEVLLAETPDIVLAQGDTTTVMVAALAAFYRKIPYGHIEAGLRTFNLYNPFPEEANRVLASCLATWHFAPTASAKDNLLHQGIQERQIYVTGNTVIDALLQTVSQNPSLTVDVPSNKRLILVTAHRRENFGEPLQHICQALNALTQQNSDVHVLFPVHPNPNVKAVTAELLSNNPQITLCEPLEYASFVAAIQHAYLILTDSGGLQEEAPALAKPVLVLRHETERPEAVAAGVVKLVGTETQTIIAEAQRLLDDPVAYQEMARGISPYGDGHAAARIVSILKNHSC